jgi:hypothetical protein
LATLATCADVSPILDAFWRAAAYCMHPRVIALSLAPLLLASGLTLALGYFFWEPAVAAVRSTLEGWSLIDALLRWLEARGAGGLRALLAPLVIVALALPAIVVLSLLMVALLMAPALVSLVARRRFADLEARRGAALWQSVLWSLGCTLVALLALALSIPLWFVPPLVLVLPPLIWGWLTYRVMAFDVLAEHASAAERRTILHEQRWPLLVIGVVCGYLGAAPTLLWAAGAATLIFAPLLVLVSVWLYTLVFAFAALWFAHFALAALQRLRAAALPAASAAAQTIEAFAQP